MLNLVGWDDIRRNILMIFDLKVSWNSVRRRECLLLQIYE